MNAQANDGRPLVAGRRVSAFTDEEENVAGLVSAMPFLLETRFRKMGAHIEAGPNFQPFAIRDGNLITGQTPASSAEVAALVIAAIRESAELRHTP